MLAIITKFICTAFLTIMGLIVVKNISGSKEQLFTTKSIILIILLLIITTITYNLSYTFIYTIITYGLTILTYKHILNISYTRSTLCCGIMLVSLFVLDCIASIILAIFISLETARNTWYINIISNTLFSIILIYVYSIKPLVSKTLDLVQKIETKKGTRIILFLILTIIAMSIISYILGINFSINSIFTTYFLIFIIFLLLVIILLGERSSYEKLSDEYDSLFNYVKIFEDWIETEQLNRHEYKNQLAVLRCMTKEKKVKEKIDSIISENINIDSQMVNQLKNLPSGGFKGLLYYKITIARNQKIHLEIDISTEVGKILNKLSEDKLKILSKLIGIYCDNAIEAAKETNKKLVLIEIYDYKKIINIVISNSFNYKEDISKRYQKGISTKGPGRGYGLYFANKIISKNDWIEEKQEIVDKFYIQKIIIKTQFE